MWRQQKDKRGGFEVSIYAVTRSKLLTKMLSSLRSGATWATLFAFSRAVASIAYEEYILAPDSRILKPRSVRTVNGSVTNAAALLEGADGFAIFNSSCWVTLDYEKNIGGLLSVEVKSSSSENVTIGVTFSESSEWISPLTSDGMSDGAPSEILYLSIADGPGVYSLSEDHIRGGFRYLTLSTTSGAVIEVASVTTNFTAAPHRDPRDYTGYFNCDDDLLNRIWYAGECTMKYRQRQASKIAQELILPSSVPSTPLPENPTSGERLQLGRTPGP